MKQRTRINGRPQGIKTAVMIAALAVCVAACDRQLAGLKPDAVSRPLGGNYIQTNLVSNGTVADTNPDTHLINPWGLTFGPTTVAWVADNGTGVSTLYDGNGVPQPLVVTIPLPPGSGKGASKPTGIAYNASAGFVVTDGTNSGPARFLFATEEGTIAGWSPAVPPPAPSTQAFIAVDNSTTGAIYKGLALGGAGDTARLYATDFHHAKIDVFDSSFTPIHMNGQFTDSNLPAGFAPFGIANLGGQIFVTYAMQDKNGEDDVPGPGLGYVDIYSQDGALLRRLVSQGQLNAPWGLAIAPSNFGRFSRKLLVGNFGDGKINGYLISNGHFHGQVQDSNGDAIVIGGLWALVFGNGAHNQPVNSLFFTAGPNGEADGLYGKIEAAHPDDPSPDAITD